MKRNICIGLAALLLTMCFAGCQNSEDKDSTKATEPSAAETTETAAETTAVTEAAESTAETTAPDGEKPDGQPEGGAPQGGPPQIELDLEAEYDESKYLNYVDKPKCKPDDAAKEADFKGLWVVDVMAKGDTAYDTICGVPVSATGHLEIDEGGAGKFINIQPVVVSSGQQGGAPQSAGAEQSTEAEATETELPMTYTYENGVLNASVTIPVGPPKSAQTQDAMKGLEENASTVQGGPPPKQMILQMTDDGRILVESPEEDGTMTSAYYKKVDAFEKFDWSSVNFDFEATYKK